MDRDDKIFAIVMVSAIASFSIFTGAAVVAAIVAIDCDTKGQFRYESAFLKRPVSIECKGKVK